jgi:type IV pilus assembly protein PilF
VGTFLKWRYKGFLICILFLQACQQNTNPPNDVSEAGIKKKHRSDASSYNVQLGLAYLKQGNIPRSKRKLFLALEQSPQSPEANAAMAYFMEKTGELEHAKSYYKKAMDAAPGRGAQLNNYGAFLCRQGQYSQAEVYFLKAVNDVQYEHTAGAYENAGLCALAIPDDAKAAHYFQTALEQDPTSRQSLYELIKLQLKHGRYEDALTQLEKYPEIVLQSRDILTLAIQAAHKAGKIELEANYRRSLDIFGVKQNDNSDNG